MKILVDADACPVVKQVESVAKKMSVPVILFCDTNHILTSDYSRVETIGAGSDAVDIALINSCREGDIVVTHDYGLAAMVLGKKAYAIHQSGRIYTNENIDRLLMERHIAKKARRAARRNHYKTPKAEMSELGGSFFESLRLLIEKSLNEENESNRSKY